MNDINIDLDLTLNLSFTGDVIKQFYLPILVPIGVVGNFLSFLVRIFIVSITVELKQPNYTNLLFVPLTPAHQYRPCT